jgi:hypothetical protein
MINAAPTMKLRPGFGIALPDIDVSAVAGA